MLWSELRFESNTRRTSCATEGAGSPKCDEEVASARGEDGTLTQDYSH